MYEIINGSISIKQHPNHVNISKMDRSVVCFEFPCQMNRNVKSDIIWKLSTSPDFSGGLSLILPLKVKYPHRVVNLYICLFVYQKNVW